MKLERQERAMLHQALQQLITGAEDLELFTQLQLDERLANITDHAALPVMLLQSSSGAKPAAAQEGS